MTQKINIVVKRIYGRDVFYADEFCVPANLLLKLTGTKTFTERHIAVLKELGYLLNFTMGESITAHGIASKGGIAKAKKHSPNSKKHKEHQAFLKERDEAYLKTEGGKRWLAAQKDKEESNTNKPTTDISDLI